MKTMLFAVLTVTLAVTPAIAGTDLAHIQEVFRVSCRRQGGQKARPSRHCETAQGHAQCRGRKWRIRLKKGGGGTLGSQRHANPPRRAM